MGIRASCAVAIAMCLFGAAVFAAPRPKLAVIVVIDQLSEAHLQKRLDEGQAPNIARLMSSGFRFLDARYDSAPALSAPGHASIATGAWPEIHGVIGNEWYDAKRGRFVNCVEDPAFKTLGRDPKPLDGTAPTSLRAGSLGESLKLRYADAKVVGVAGEDRAAMLLSGRGADLALWIDDAAPRFTTSTAYAKELPEWVSAENEKIQKAIAGGFRWSLPRGGITGKNPPPPRNPFADRPSPPNESPGEAFLHQPMVEGFVVDLALSAVKELKLGEDASPDLLTVSFSSFEKVLHAWGPDSDQAFIALQMIDEEVKRLVDGLDAAVGRGKYVLVLTADRGGMPLPETLTARKIDSGTVKSAELCAALDAAADKVLGDGNWMVGFRNTGCYAHANVREKVHTADAAIIEAGEKTRGVRRLFSKPRLLNGESGAIASLYRRGLDAERSPDFLVATQPFWEFGPQDATGHASWHLYDRRVPLALVGPGIRVGKGERAETIDIAPTLARVLGCEPPVDAQGRVLTEALAQ